MPEIARASKGQAIVLVALGLVALIAFAGLALDGGSALLQRRNMQNASDAGALAGVLVLEQSPLTVTCSPAPCHPFFLDPPTQAEVFARANELAQANHGGTIGSVTLTAILSFHIMAGGTMPDGTTCDANANPNGCYAASTNDSTAVPAFTDGVRVDASIENPTAFLSVLNVIGINLSTVHVGAVSAAAFLPTCAVAQSSDVALPWTRFRPMIEEELLTAGNDPNHLFPFWTSHQDIGGPMNGNWKNTISLGATSTFDHNTQPLTRVDTRNGYPAPDGSGVGPDYPPASNAAQCDANPPYPNLPDSTRCADMRGESGGDVQDQQNWIYYGWNGAISIPNGDWTGTSDWADTKQMGDKGNNIFAALASAIAARGYVTQFLGTTTGALDATLLAWGPPLGYLEGHSDTTTARTWVSGGQNRNTFQPITLTRRGNGDYRADSSVDRVRFTRLFHVRFYLSALQNSSEGPGLIIADKLPGPEDGCIGDWSAGASVYYRLVDP